MASIDCAVAAADRLGESPLWCARTRRLWWTDVHRPALQSYDPASGRHEVRPQPGRSLGCLALRQAGGLVLALDSALHAYDVETDERNLLLELEPGRTGLRLNDGKADPRGRFWIGSMNPDAFVPVGRLHRVGADLATAALLHGIIVPNSIAFAPDGRTFYFADTRRYTIWAYVLDLDDGVITDRRLFAETRGQPGRPDGSCIDAEGCLWNAEYAGGRVVRYAPDGRVDRVVTLPVSHPTCVAFGGDRLDRLYVTSAAQALASGQRSAEPLAGALLALDVGVAGLPEPMVGF
jgi:sugar lactone lactonase YvrE